MNYQIPHMSKENLENKGILPRTLGVVDTNANNIVPDFGYLEEELRRLQLNHSLIRCIEY